MNGNGRYIAYIAGNVYKSEKDGCITNVWGDVTHSWSVRYRDVYFKPISRVVNPSKRLLGRLKGSFKKIKSLGYNLNVGKDKEGWFFCITPITYGKGFVSEKRFEHSNKAWVEGFNYVSRKFYKEKIL